jgi:hypothetical protein
MLVLLAVYYLFIHPLFLRHFLPTLAMARKKITRDKLIAHAKANSYKNSLRGRNKHRNKAKQDQDAALDCYIL